MHNRTTTNEEITDQVLATNKEDIDTSTHYEQEYNTASGRPVTQSVQVYTAIKVAYENVSNPEAWLEQASLTCLAYVIFNWKASYCYVL